MQQIGRLQSVFDEYGVRPVYVVDYPIAAQSASAKPLRELLDAGRASIGGHLHPWVTPPYEETLSSYNSYHGNLGRELEGAKLTHLTEKIRHAFGIDPLAFKAGRYGIGPNTYGLLRERGYRVDLSPAPALDCSEDGGPDFSNTSCEPLQDRASGLLVLPNSGGFVGWWPADKARGRRWATSGWRRHLHVNALLNRSGALRRVILSPEGHSVAGMIALTKMLLERGIRVFVISMHSPSVAAGCTPYAANEEQVKEILQKLRSYFDYFFAVLRGQPWTVEEAFEYWNPKREWLEGYQVTSGSLSEGIR